MSKKVLITSRSFGKISNEPLDILTKAGFEVTMKGKDFDQAEFEAMILSTMPSSLVRMSFRRSWSAAPG